MSSKTQSLFVYVSLNEMISLSECSVGGQMSPLVYAALAFIVLSVAIYVLLMLGAHWMSEYRTRRDRRLRREEKTKFVAQATGLVPGLLTRRQLICYVNPDEQATRIGSYLPLHHSLFLAECGRMKPIFGIRAIHAFWCARVLLLNALSDSVPLVRERLWALLVPRVVFRGYDNEGQHYEEESEDAEHYTTEAPYRHFYLRALAKILPNLVKFEQRGDSSRLLRLPPVENTTKTMEDKKND